MTDGQGVVSRKAAFWLLTAGSVSFACMILVEIFGDRLGPGTDAGANAYSRSAIGHRALVETLQRLDIPVVVSRHRSGERAGENALLIVAEPDIGADSPESIGDIIADAYTVMLVLPKWQGRADPLDRGWLETMALVPAATAEAVLHAVLPDGRVVRTPEDPTWAAGGLDGALAPEIDGQLIASRSLTPLIRTKQGILVGETLSPTGQRIVIVSDPDILSNHGLGRADNAAIIVGLIQQFRPADGAVIFDEVLHGFARRPSIWQRLFELPLAVPTALSALAVGVLLWSATGRFGAPALVAARLRAGKQDLIANAAELLTLGRHGGETLRRYLSVTVRAVAARNRARPGLDEAAQIDWMDRLGKQRGVRPGIRELRDDVAALADASSFDAAAALRLAARLHRWKKDMTHGS